MRFFWIVASFSFVASLSFLEAAELFSPFALGDSLESVEKKLAEHALFIHEGIPEVKLLFPQKDAQGRITFQDRKDFLLEAAGAGPLLRASFQFKDDTLYAMTVYFKEQFITYHGLVEKLTELHGEALRISPNVVIWRKDNAEVQLHRDLSLRYIDAAFLDQLNSQEQNREVPDFYEALDRL